MIEEKLQWKTKFETGIPEVDFQHKYFLQMINRLYGRMKESPSREEISSMLKEILYYSNFHFLSETNLMRYYEYPGVREHQALHERISTELLYKITLFDEDKLDIHELILFLLNWFIDHTVKEDSKFGLYRKSDT